MTDLHQITHDIATALDVITLLAMIVAIAIMAARGRGWLGPGVRTAVIGILALLGYHSLSNALEGLGITAVLDVYEDYSELLLPVFFFMAVFVFLQDRSIEQLRASERSRELVLWGGELGTWDWNVRMGTVEFNERWAAMLGYELDELEPVTATWERLVHPDDLPATVATLEAHLRSETDTYETEYRMGHKSGDWIWVLDKGKVIERGLDGEALRVCGTHLDITERRHAADEWQDLQRQIQHAQKLESLGVLAGGIAHDFNNLLMGILGNADLALDELSPVSPARRYLAEIETAAKRAAELARQMLAYSGRGRFEVTAIDLGELVTEMGHLLETSISKKAVIRYTLARDLPTFDGDATQIRQVIMNLITNASEAIGDQDGVISLTTGVMDCDRQYLDGVDFVLQAGLDEPLPAGRYLYLEVSDTGCGMPHEVIDRIFDPFFTTKFTGRGLGMSVVLGIVRGHGGAVKIYSEVEQGTTFKIIFPVGGNRAGVGEGAAAAAQPAAGNWRGAGTVLVADDEESVRAISREMLGRLGFDVLTAVDGQEAVDILRAEADRIVCVLLDLTMPRLDGQQAFREMRGIRSDVKVILCSGYNEQEAVRHFVGKGLASFLHKPYTLASLRAKMREVMGEE